MKISLGINIQPGPWGGGNQFGQSLSSFLQKKGVEISFDLKQNNLDLILLIDPRSSSKTSAFNHLDIFRYLWYKNSQALIVHRINECDERKGTKNVNQMIIHANTVADFSVYVSKWLQNIYANMGLPPIHSRVIMNGANSNIFNSRNYKPWNKTSKLKMVTHHWGTNYLKGFDIYEKFDQLLFSPNFSNKYEFMFIGKLPKSFRFLNTIYIEPKFGSDLSSHICLNHVYLTASQNEPGANHPIEGALCGLPILYRPSGSLAEYCHGYGIEFTSENFKEKLNEMYETYFDYVGRMKDYPYTADRMCQQYYELFLELLDKKEEIIQSRHYHHKFRLFVESFLPIKLLGKIRGKIEHWMS
ncbi:MAG: hypothetical protein GYA34_11055 [Chloroflexi bacterium]|nr:hypothetical protein [Chloroflexota bacterium]